MKWLLIRGLARTRPHWDQFPGLLEKAHPQNQVYCLDLPGVGEFEAVSAPLKISEYADWLHLKFQQIKGESNDWGLIAISLGGMIGLQWVASYPSDFKALVTMNTSAGNLCGPTERLSPAAIATIGKLFLSRDVARRERAILELTTNQKEISDELVARWVQIDQAHPLKRETFVRQLIAAGRFRAPKRLPIKPLILVSETDRLTSANCSKKLAKQLGCEYISHPQAGHDLPLDDPQWAVDQIIRHYFN